MSFEMCNITNILHMLDNIYVMQEISEADGRVRVESRKNLSCFVIEGAERSDEGLYHISVMNPAGEDKADVMVKIVGEFIHVNHLQLLFFLFFIIYYVPSVP